MTPFFKEHLRTTYSEYKVFSSNYFTHIPEIFGIFRERFISEIIRLFLLFMSGTLISLVTGWNSDYIDKVFMQSKIKKIRNFLMLLCHYSLKLFHQR